MIYLLQDSYLDDQDNSHKVLKIGYSKEYFNSIRQKQYNTHNYGYKLLAEREGDIELETYLHKRYKSLRLNGEWFKWDQRIIDEFPNIQLEDISKEEYLEYLKKYILSNLLPIPKKLKELYLKELLEELKETYDSQPEHQCFLYHEYLLKREILHTWKLVFQKIHKFISNYNLVTLLDLNFPEIIGKYWLDDDVFRNQAILIYSKIIKEIPEEDLNESINEKSKRTESVIKIFNQLNNQKDKDTFRNQIKMLFERYSYQDDYIDINEKTGNILMNRLVMLAEKRAVEIQSLIYSSDLL